MDVHFLTIPIYKETKQIHCLCLYIIRKLGTWALVHFQILRFVYFHSFYLILSPKKDILMEVDLADWHVQIV